MRGVLAVIWAFIVFGVTAVVVNLCATIGFPPGSSSALILRIAGLIIALGLGINAYKKSAKPPAKVDGSGSPPAA